MFQILSAWQSITLWKRVLIGLVIGLTIGLLLRYTTPASTIEKTLDIDVANFEAGQTSLETTLAGMGFTQDATVEGFPQAQHGTVKVDNDGQVRYTPNEDYRGKDQIKVACVEPYAIANFFGKQVFQPFGDLFVRLIKMLIIPLIATTLVSGVIAMGDPKKLGSLGIKTLALYLGTTLFAVTLGLILGTLIQPGVGIDFQNAGDSSVASVEGKIELASNSGSLVDRLLAIVPTNPVEAMASNDVLATIFFSMMIGVGILLAGKKGASIGQFFDAAAEVVMKVTVLIMELAPFGVLALMAWVMATRGVEILSNLLWLTLALYAACVLQIFFVYGGLIIGVLLRLPLVQFFKGIADAQGVAFSTASSSATLPMTISCAEKNLGVEKSVAGSVLPLGATINMDGTAIYLGLIALFAAQALGIDLSIQDYVMVALTATLASVGAAGIPSAGLLLAATVLQVIDVEQEQAVLIIAFIFPFDRLLDMMRTLTNVSGDIAVACTVAKWEDALDEDVFRTEAEI